MNSDVFVDQAYLTYLSNQNEYETRDHAMILTTTKRMANNTAKGKVRKGKAKEGEGVIVCPPVMYAVTI